MDLFPLWNSLRIAAIASVAVFFSGILLAYYVARLPRVLKGLLDVALTLPLVLPPTVCGWFLLLLFGRNHPVGRWLGQWGFQFVMTWYGGVLAAAVVAFPLMYRTARGAFESFDETLAWSGKTLGLSRTATISTTVYQLWRTNDDAGAVRWVLINLAISTVVLLAVNLLEKKQQEGGRRR